MPWALPEYSRAPLALVVHSWKRPPRDLPVGGGKAAEAQASRFPTRARSSNRNVGTRACERRWLRLKRGRGHRVPGTVNGLCRHRRCARSTLGRYRSARVLRTWRTDELAAEARRKKCANFGDPFAGAQVGEGSGAHGRAARHLGDAAEATATGA